MVLLISSETVYRLASDQQRTKGNLIFLFGLSGGFAHERSASAAVCEAG
jgi:hypothetical protein